MGLSSLRHIELTLQLGKNPTVCCDCASLDFPIYCNVVSSVNVKPVLLGGKDGLEHTRALSSLLTSFVPLVQIHHHCLPSSGQGTIRLPRVECPAGSLCWVQAD